MPALVAGRRSVCDPEGGRGLWYAPATPEVGRRIFRAVFGSCGPHSLSIPMILVDRLFPPGWILPSRSPSIDSLDSSTPHEPTALPPAVRIGDASDGLATTRLAATRAARCCW